MTTSPRGGSSRMDRAILGWLVSLACLLAPRLQAGTEIPPPSREQVARTIEQARAGDAHAQYLVGMMLSRGRGLRQDSEKAARWFRKAFDGGQPRGAFRLGKLYQQGFSGVPPQPLEAIVWLHRAAEAGVVPAVAARQAAEEALDPAQTFELALRYLYVVLPGEAEQRAVALLQRAAGRGSAQAQEKLDELAGVPRPSASSGEEPLPDPAAPASPGDPASGTLLVFSGPQCPWCKVFDPVVREVSARYGNLQLQVIDTSTEAGAELSQEHGVDGIPTSVLLGPGGEARERLDGCVPEERLVGFLEENGFVADR